MRITIQERYAKTLYKEKYAFNSIESFIEFFNNRVITHHYKEDDVYIYIPETEIYTDFYEFPYFKFEITGANDEIYKKQIVVCRVPITDLPCKQTAFNDIHELQDTYGTSLDNYNPEIYSIKTIIDMLNGNRKDSLNNDVDVLHILKQH